MNQFSQSDGVIDLPNLWQALEDLEQGDIDPSQRDELTVLLNHSPAARRAYFEYFQQSAVFRMEAAKLHERGLLPRVNPRSHTRWAFPHSVMAAAALLTLAAIVASLITVTRKESPQWAAESTAETRWYIDGVTQDSVRGPVAVTKGSIVTVSTGTLRLTMDSGDLLAIQGPAKVSFPALHQPRVEYGWLWIDAEKSSESFRIEAGDLLIRDIGTRFGVRVPQEGSLEVHLVSGRVKVVSLKNNALRGDLSQPGLAHHFTADGEMKEIALAGDPFRALPDLLQRPSTYRTTVLGQSPTGYWSLDAPVDRKVTNEVEQSSVGGYGEGVRDGDAGPGPKEGYHGFSATNASLYFEGTSSSSVLSGLDGIHGVKRNEGAVSFWIRCKTEDIPHNQVLWLAGSGHRDAQVPSDAFLQTRLTPSRRIVFEIKNDGGNLRLSASRRIQDENWHHVVASWGPSSVDLYLDGKLVARDTQTRTLDKGEVRGRFVRFGKPSHKQRENFNLFNGWLDEIALWDRPLTPAEVEAQYRSARGRVSE